MSRKLPQTLTPEFKLKIWKETGLEPISSFLFYLGVPFLIDYSYKSGYTLSWLSLSILYGLAFLGLLLGSHEKRYNELLGLIKDGS